MSEPASMTRDSVMRGGAASTIHDLGYRRYEGARDGARGAFRTLFWQGFRTMFGVGRPWKSKAVPVFVVVVSMLPSLASVVAVGASQGQIPLQYAGVYSAQLVLFLLFSAAQAPEMLSRDQQHRVLPLILTRNVTRTSYALARLSAMFTAMFLVCLAPLLLLYLGEIGVAKVPSETFATMGGKIGPALLMATLAAMVYSTVSAALASFTSRRAYATASIIGLFLVSTAIALGLRDLAGVPNEVNELIDPLRALGTLATVLFGETTRGMELNPPPPVAAFLAVFAIIAAGATAVLVWRLRRVTV